MFFGLLAASFFSRAALLAAVNANVPSPRVLSLAVRSIIIVFVLSIVFEELGLAEQTMLVAFGIAFGALMLGLGNRIRHRGQRLGPAFSGEEVCSREEGGERGRIVAALAWQWTEGWRAPVQEHSRERLASSSAYSQTESGSTTLLPASVTDPGVEAG